MEEGMESTKSKKSLNDSIRWAIKFIEPGDVFFKASESDVSVSLKECLYVILENIECLKENDGQEEWEQIKDKFKDKLEIAVLKNVENKSANWQEVIDLCLVFIFEIHYINHDDGLRNILNDLLGARDYFKEHEAVRSLGSASDSFEKYASGTRKSIDLYRKANASESMIKNEINKRLGSYKNKEEELGENINELKKQISALKGETSFLASSKVFSKLESNARSSGGFLFLCVVFFAVITVLYIFLVVYYLSGNVNPRVPMDSLGDSVRLEFWREVRLIDIKLFAVSSTFVFLGIYFFRVFLSLYQKNNRKLDELELKSAIAFYIEGHVKFVKESGGDSGRSIEKYEDFMFGEKIETEELTDAPNPTDTLKDVGEVAEKLVKAGKS